MLPTSAPRMQFKSWQTCITIYVCWGFSQPTTSLFRFGRFNMANTRSEEKSAERKHENEQLSADVRPLTDEIRREIIQEIESYMLDIARETVAGISFSSASRQTRQVLARFSVKASRRKIALLTFLLSKIHRLLTTKSTCSRRELYYERVDLFRSQRQVDITAKHASKFLQRPPWHLCLTTTSKGLIAGPLLIVSADGRRLNCNAQPTGTLLPKDVLSIVTLESSARFILVVEKDTVFQKLVQQDAPRRLGHCLLVTGKGYPDVDTRLVLWRLQKQLNIPMFALVDADPHGIDIMWTYKFGPSKISASGHLTAPALPSLRWLGLHPTDIAPLGLLTSPITSEDRRLATSLLRRAQLLTDTKCAVAIRQQVEEILLNEKKAEIESLAKCSGNYLVDVYIPRKISNADYY